ncbi:DoxX family protein [Nocardia stercoris]|uniref:DoxX family protein n=1 Tax=Nocardia stercoris TaxID=2483361 RepID=A0A3M2LM58_9NOCA|nr:DoxX family protein [Nocardia stercoris]RMI35838.1 DoxX family protein [Nocardia stercoris]
MTDTANTRTPSTVRAVPRQFAQGGRPAGPGQPARPVPRTDEELGLEPEVPGNGPAASSPATVPTRKPAPRSADLDDDDDDSDGTYVFASIPAAPDGRTGLRSRRDDRRGTTDLGLLALRVLIGLTFIYHGLSKATTMFHGQGIEATHAFLEHGGWKQVELSAAMTIVAEIGGGAMILVGLATPLASGAVLATILDAWLWKQSVAPGFQYKALELETILIGAVTALLFTGPGRWSADRNRGWATRPAYGSVICFAAALAAAAATWLALHGGNPFVGTFG